MSDNVGFVGRRHWLWKVAPLCALSLGLVGCGGGGGAPVSGTVKWNGKAVTGGTLMFSPQGSGEVGKAASAEVQSDGTYKAGTNKPGDGATVGKHKVTFLPPEPKLTDEQRTNPKFTPPPPQFAGLVPKQADIEVKSGPNTIDIELVPGKR